MFAPDGTVCAARIPGRAVSWNEQGRRAARDGERVLRATGGRSLENGAWRSWLPAVTGFGAMWWPRDRARSNVCSVAMAAGLQLTRLDL